ncbi:MAG: HAD family hydrolase [Clostridiaceae bacterium]|nr:HAD family hydrolase [Clostridiaceae bacterium]
MIFDKTGTLTVGKPSVPGRMVFGDRTGRALVDLASVERESGHPLAKAILENIGETVFPKVTETDVIKGGEIVAFVGDGINNNPSLALAQIGNTIGRVGFEVIKSKVK